MLCSDTIACHVRTRQHELIASSSLESVLFCGRTALSLISGGFREALHYMLLIVGVERVTACGRFLSRVRDWFPFLLYVLRRVWESNWCLRFVC